MEFAHDSISDYGFVYSSVQGKRDSLFTKPFYRFLMQSSSISEFLSKFIGTVYNDYIHENIKDKTDLRNSLYRAIHDDINEMLNMCPEIKSITDFFYNKYSVEKFIKTIRRPEKIDENLGYFEELHTLKFSKDMNEVKLFCIENTFLKDLINFPLRLKIEENNMQEMESKIKKNLYDSFVVKENMEGMKKILAVEGDRMIVEIVLSMINEESPERKELFPQWTTFSLGQLQDLNSTKNIHDLKQIIKLEDQEDEKIIECMMKRELKAYKAAFYSFQDIAMVYAYLQLKEREIQNIIWVYDCLKLGKSDHIENIVAD